MRLSSHLSLGPPTPEEGLTLTSIAASSGSSSRRLTSTGPLTAARMVKRVEAKVAEPSARVRGWVVSSGLIFGGAQGCSMIRAK